MFPTRRTAILGGQKYFEKVKGLFGASIVGYWPFWDAVGSSTAVDISGNARHGTPTNCTFGAAGIGDGTAVSLVGASASRISVLTPIAAIFPGAEGSILMWGQTSTWSLSNKQLFNFNVDASNKIYAYADGVNNITCRYVAGGTTESLTVVPGPAITAWHLALTWSATGDAVISYLRGAAIGSSGTLGTWAGGSLAEAFWGYESTNTWTGVLAHGILLNRAATAPEVAKAASV